MSETTARPAMIELDHLVKIYGQRRAVDDVTLRVYEGDILGFLGPNGAGKTTSMRILTGYTPPTSGTARVGGVDVRRDSKEARRMIGYLPESAPLYRDMEVCDYLTSMAEVKGHRGVKARDCVDRVVDECNLEPVTGRLIRNLSKGYRQRVGLAQALLGDPKVLVLDEPTVGLDPSQIVEIRQLIKGMAGRRTVILSTHILPEVAVTCNRVAIINQGRIEAEGTPDRLVSSLGEQAWVMMTVEGAFARSEEILRGVDGVRAVALERTQGAQVATWRVQVDPSSNLRPALAAAVVNAGLGLLEMQSSGTTLEDIFLRIIARQDEAGPAAGAGKEVA